MECCTTLGGNCQICTRLFTFMWSSCRWNHLCPWRIPPLHHSPLPPFPFVLLVVWWHVACHCSVICRSIRLLVVCCHFLLRYFRRFSSSSEQKLGGSSPVQGGKHLRVVSESSDVGGDILYIKSTNLDLGSGSGMAQNIRNQKSRIVHVWIHVYQNHAGAASTGRVMIGRERLESGICAIRSDPLEYMASCLYK